MKDDTDKYKPDVAKVLEEMDPARVLERRRQTLAKFYGGENAREAEPAEARVSAPSPWGKGGASAEVNKAALPSAMMPATDVPPMTTPVGTRQARRRWPASWKVAGGLALVVAATFGLMVGVMAGRAKERTKAAETASAGVVPSVTATVPTASAIPVRSATALPTAPPAPALSVPPPSSATMHAPDRPHLVPKPFKAADEPHTDSAVKPLPAVTSTPSVAPVAPPPPKPEIIN